MNDKMMKLSKNNFLDPLFDQVIGPQMKIWFGWKIGQGPEHRAKVPMMIMILLLFNDDNEQLWGCTRNPKLTI